LNTTATATIERRLYLLPLPQLLSIATVKRQRSPLSIAAVKPDTRHRHLPPLMSISILASTLPMRICHCLSVAPTAIAVERCPHH